MDAKIPEMLTIQETSKRTGISYRVISQLCKENKIAHIQCGKKCLVNLDRFIDYLNGEQTNE